MVPNSYSETDPRGYANRGYADSRPGTIEGR